MNRSPLVHRRARLEMFDDQLDRLAAVLDGAETEGSSEVREFLLTSQHAGDLVRGESRAFTSGTSNTGGSTCPQGFADRVEFALKSSASMLGAGTIVRTPSGTSLPYPTVNYTATAGGIVGEGNTSTTDTSTPFGSVNLGAFSYRSRLVPISYEFLDDSIFDEGMLARMLADSIWRGANPHFTTGSGSGQPTGLMTATSTGVTAAAGNTTGIPYATLIDGIHALDAAYLEPDENGTLPAWMMNVASLKTLRKLVDSAGAPLDIWDTDRTGRVTLLGYPVRLNPDMAVMAANAKPIAFGRLDRYTIRQSGVHLFTSVERFSDNLQVCAHMLMRFDGNLIDAGTHPVVYLQNSAT